MLTLNNVTLIAMTSVRIEAAVRALEYSCLGVRFAEVKLVSHVKPNNLNKIIKYEEIDVIKNIDDFSYKAIYKLPAYIDTDYGMLIHSDGFVVNPASWRDDFLQYDYIGAPWALPQDHFSYRDIFGNIVRVGNGVSLRSKKLMDLANNLNLVWEPYFGFYNEDGFICTKNRHIYEANGMKYAPLEIAKYFSHEVMIPEIIGIRPFAFHKWRGQNAIYPQF
jgi:hypothetical protein